MCFKGPKPPKPTAEQLAAEADSKAQREAALMEQREARAVNKRNRLQLALRRNGNGFGRASLLSGAAGGAGYGASPVRSLLQVNG